MPTIDESRLETTLDALLARVESTMAATGEEFPLYAHPNTGEWETTPDGDWCGGHWIGLLWLASRHASGERSRRFSECARDHMDTVHNYLPRSSMFYGMAHDYAGFRAYDITGDRRLFGFGLDGADAMVESFHEGARQVPLGDLAIRGPENFRGPESDHGPSGTRVGAVDSVYTALPVLWRAYRETGDARFRDVAVSHADKHLDWYVRPDGSTWHHAVFDPETGNLERQYNELAHSDETCWARGQGWNVAGLARAYQETGARRYLDVLEQTVAYYVEESPPDLVANWDFAAPQGPGTPRDTSAAALVAYGLVRLDAGSAPSEHAERVVDLRRTGEQILESLLTDYLITEPDDDRYGMVKHGCYNYPGGFATDNELVWTDYYVMKAVSTLLEEW